MSDTVSTSGVHPLTPEQIGLVLRAVAAYPETVDDLLAAFDYHVAHCPITPEDVSPIIKGKRRSVGVSDVALLANLRVTYALHVLKQRVSLAKEWSAAP